MIKKRCYWMEGVPGDQIDTQFEDKEVGDVGMIKAITEENKLFKIFLMKEPDYVMKMMASWMKIDELEGARKRRDFIDSSGTKDTQQFTYWKTFGINFRYRNQLYNHNNWIHVPIYLERTWATKFWPYHKFA